VPPPNSLRGVFSIAEASASAEASSLTTIHGTTWTCRRGAGPLVHGDGDRLGDAGADGGKDARIAERIRIACFWRSKRRMLTLPDASTASTS